MTAQQPQNPTGQITLTYDRETGDVNITGGQLVAENSNFPIQTQHPVKFEAILIYHPGCIWFRGQIIC